LKINFSIIDVNLTLVESTLEYVATQTTTNVTGKLGTVSGNATLTLPDDVWTVSVSITPIEHNDDLVRLRKVKGSSEWQVDNPACRIASSGSELLVTLTVGRLRPAPTVHVPDEQISKIAGNPAGVLLFKDNEGLIYHSLFAVSYESFFRLNHPILNPVIKDNAAEWERLRTVPSKVDPKNSGIFFHLEYGDRKSGPRLFLSLYLPSPGIRKALDYIVFFSPTTAISKFPIDKFPFRGSYPYGLIDKKDQGYPRHSQSYLFSNHHLVHQLLAAESKAVIVMPVAPYGDWSVFETREGLHRLLQECTLFLHREYLSTQYASVRPSWPEYARAGGSVHLPTGMGAGVASSIFARFEPVPPIARVAVAAFSSGCRALQSLLIKTTKFPEGFTKARFGMNDTSVFEKVFQEVWDIDGAHSPYHGYAAFEMALSNWYKDDRRFRLYHSQYTGGDHDSMLSEGLKHLRKPTDIVNDATVMDKDKGMSYWAKERHAANGRWSCVRFDNNFITSSGNPSDSHPQWKPSDPEGKNAHQFVPRIAFGHASYLFNKSQS
jgi:hypothetical protein